MFHENSIFVALENSRVNNAGASGTLAAITVFGSEGKPIPTSFLALTLYVYVAPVISPYDISKVVEIVVPTSSQLGPTSITY